MTPPHNERTGGQISANSLGRIIIAKMVREPAGPAVRVVGGGPHFAVPTDPLEPTMSTHTIFSFDDAMRALCEAIPPVIAQPPAYPFVGVKAVKARLEADTDVQKATLLMLYFLQTGDEQQAKDTHHKNKAGFMSSDAYVGTRLAEKMILGIDLDSEEEGRVSRITTKYSKQLSIQLRRVAMEQDPRLAAYAVTFSIR